MPLRRCPIKDMQMKKLLLACLLAAGSCSAVAETISFDAFPVGGVPAGWQTGTSGRKDKSVWTIEADATAPSAPNVLRQSGASAYPWCVKTGTSFTNGMVEVKFKPVSGERAQAGGIMFRFKDATNYYVARANANENNVNLYWFDAQGRHEIKAVSTPVSLGQWHMLRVDYEGKHIRVAMDGKTLIEVDDEHVPGPGAVGLWTRFDSNTMFDDFTFTGT